ncbi:hypothetical protein HID58_020457 [Brassica napus]|uniref:Uncharacterized protein n=1 Tax=Brassica napus TaxID=3708 RepID=A0ABQ7XJ77_BRANA|nr:hypothetical protein HID58_020457 [Brassica napus]
MHLDLRNNLISGVIPPDFGRLTMLSRALLSGNRITGRIPESLTRIYRLADVDLSGNQLYGPDSSVPRPNMLQGKIPEGFGPRSYFTVLDCLITISRDQSRDQFLVRRLLVIWILAITISAGGFRWGLRSVTLKRRRLCTTTVFAANL